MGTIARIDKEHISKCSKLYIDVFNSSPWNDAWSIETAYTRLNDIYNSPNFEGVVYMENKEVKGAIFGNLEQYYNGLHYNLKEIFIHNHIQQKGFGSELLSYLEKRLQTIGVTDVILFTSRDMGISNFYAKNNYSEITSLKLMGKEFSSK